MNVIMPEKIIWIDCETTGLKSENNCLVQLAYIVDRDGKVITEGDITCAPAEGATVDKAALDVHGRTIEEIQDYQPITSAHTHFTGQMSLFVDRYNKLDKFTIAGYFVGFDIEFLRRFFKDSNDKWYGSWFKSIYIDVQCFVAQYVLKKKLFPPNFKLATIYQEITGKQLEHAHDALADVRATREIYYTIMENLHGKAGVRP